MTRLRPKPVARHLAIGAVAGINRRECDRLNRALRYAWKLRDKIYPDTMAKQ